MGGVGKKWSHAGHFDLKKRLSYSKILTPRDARAACGDYGLWRYLAAQYGVVRTFGEHMRRKKTGGGEQLLVFYGPDTEITLSRAAAVDGFIGGWTRSHRARSCRECGCTEHDACITKGTPCSWVEDDLCSACAPKKKKKGGRG
jgi:hypothetical protein